MSFSNAGAPEPVCRKKQFKVATESDHWNYLTGTGPSAPPTKQLDLQKEATFGKPSGWHSKRPGHQIDPHRETYNRTARKEAKAEMIMEMKKEYIFDKQHQGGVNPISGEEMFNPPRNTAPPHARKSVPERPQIPPELAARKAASAEVRAGLRMEVIKNNGIPPGQKGNSVQDNFRPI